LLVEDFHAFCLECIPIVCRFGGSAHAEPLFSDSMSILHPRITSIALRNSGVPCQLLCNPVGVGTGLPDTQPVVLTFARKLDGQLFGNEEILGDCANTTGKQWRGQRVSPVWNVGQAVTQYAVSATGTTW